MSKTNNPKNNLNQTTSTSTSSKKRKPRKPKEEEVHLYDKKEEEVYHEPHFLYKLFVILFGFNYLLPISNSLWGLTFILTRGYILFNIDINKIMHFLNDLFGQSNVSSERGVLYTFFIFLPVVLYILAYVIWYIWVSITVIYWNIGFFERNNYSGTGKYDQIEKLKEYRDNKMKFMSYKDATDLMRKTAVINNLDDSNPEARKTLDYINNKIKFMSYKDSIDFLNGNKK